MMKQSMRVPDTKKNAIIPAVAIRGWFATRKTQFSNIAGSSAWYRRDECGDWREHSGMACDKTAQP
jgi:hypothetical protein